MSVRRNWLRRALTVGTFGAALAVMPAAAIAAEAVMHPEGTLKLADRKLVAGAINIPFRNRSHRRVLCSHASTECTSLFSRSLWC